ncbi:MAG TPA: NAD(P)H-binding protein [Bacteroidales bacterium]|nr:NAD(P)H-binding protein [Bacteroidales bacterium]HRX98438.1 NAD(P)H-binding protein [Bacteroidales bacterium]
MKIAVTAANGHLGSEIIDHLLKHTDPKNIIGLARNPDKIKQTKIEKRKGDYDNINELMDSLNGVEVVLLVSGMAAPNTRIVQHKNVIEAALANKVRKIVYTSIAGKRGISSFDPIIKSNRQTEQDIIESGLEWAIGRNGLYIEPDIEFLDTYKKEGKIANCAGNGLCSYTTRSELAYAYSQMIMNDDRNEHIYNLAGRAITQKQLIAYLNKAFGTKLKYEEMTPKAYLDLQRSMNGEFLGTIIAGIYTKIKNGEFHVKSNFENAAGREHVSWEDYFEKIGRSKK